MAEKPRVKAPKQRTAQSPTSDKKRRGILIVVALGLAALAVAAVVALAGFGGGTDARAALASAGCTLQIAPGGKPTHSILDPNGTSKTWDTDPPTSGPHYAEPAIFGDYDVPLQRARLVHNLEHGGVYILYGKDVSASTVEQINEFWSDHQPGTIVAPYPKLGNKIALGAWYHTDQDIAQGTNGHGYLAKCTTFDKKAFAAFLRSYQFHGSHVNDPSLMLPGH